jgi:rfaE bifunctional protein nucleotidyltransferase chain/domain
MSQRDIVSQRAVKAAHMGKFSLDDARLRIEKIREGKKVVLTAGTFDIIHPGHIDYLEWCKEHGDLLVVCVIGDHRTRRRKKRGRPFVKEEWRAFMVSSLKPVDLVFVSDHLPFEEEIIAAIQPDVIVTPSDEPSKDIKTQFAAHFRSKNPEIELIMKERSSFRRKSSTTMIVERIRLTFTTTDDE